MKRALILFMILSFLFISDPSYRSIEAGSTSDFQVIPDEAIRLRILANSNQKADQELKREVRDKVNAEITKWVEELTSIEAARELIESRLPDIERIVAATIEEAGSGQSYQVDYDDSVKFPTKLYGNFVYPAGNYEAILITLGKGNGENWWCVLFPPLCFLDFSDGATVASAAEAGDQANVEAPPADEPEVDFFLVKVWNGIKNIFS
ncbi:stage II sporulation protein R [Thalassobacillus pellis]|uniref:stage II sporulation protein R n=1 Tax=Thalassobacillus pellis TaxID=748008 RepID=UPI00195F2556|nr:stage II sporulation protein R [Thalassobacillus pellis]MBM7551778.1 stage II sporulation protein R [Thalassobacillus pellis]